MGKTITKVIKVDNETKKLMNEFYKDMKRDKTPPYAIFQADTGDTIVTLYESGKAMFQGVSADIESSMWESIKKDKENIDYLIHDIAQDKINVYFGAKECVDVVKSFKNTKLNELTPEQDFMLGIMLGYDRVRQCERYMKIKNNEIKLGKQSH